MWFKGQVSNVRAQSDSELDRGASLAGRANQSNLVALALAEFIAKHRSLKRQRPMRCSVRHGEPRDGWPTRVVNHSSDSESTGQILGTIVGVKALSKRWLDVLELHDEIDAMADDLAIHYRSSGEWYQRYPGC